MRESFIRKAPLESFKDVSPKRKGGVCWLKFTPDSVAITLQPGPLYARLSIRAFIGRRPGQTLRTWSNDASVASSLQIKAICHPTPSELSPSLGLLRSGGLIWWDPLKVEPTRKNTYWSWWINSPNG